MFDISSAFGRPKRRLLTVADIATFPDDLPSGPVRWELVNGELKVDSAHSGIHSMMHTTIMVEVGIQSDPVGGMAYGTVGIVVRRNPDTVYAPDTAYVAPCSMPVKYSAEDYRSDA